MMRCSTRTAACRRPDRPREVQGYVYAAKQLAALARGGLATTPGLAHSTLEAARLRTQFDAAFWCEDLGTYAIALDGQKESLSCRTSNAGHVLFTGIAIPIARYGLPIPSGAALLFGLGNSHGRAENSLQPDVVSQRFDMAA